MKSRIGLVVYSKASNRRFVIVHNSLGTNIHGGKVVWVVPYENYYEFQFGAFDAWAMPIEKFVTHDEYYDDLEANEEEDKGLHEHWTTTN